MGTFTNFVTAVAGFSLGTVLAAGAVTAVLGFLYSRWTRQ